MKVFDSFIFFNELELLEMRLNILKDVVDYFVLTESPFTVSGNEKPLYYQENKDRFGKLNDKIIHHVTEEIPNDFSHMLEKTKYHVDPIVIKIHTGLSSLIFPFVSNVLSTIETIVLLVLRKQEQLMRTW